MDNPRLSSFVILLAAVSVVAAVFVVLQTGDRGRRSDEVAASSASTLARADDKIGKPEAARILAAWDDARADAWAAGDLAALRALYVAGSAAGQADLAMLRSYVARDLRVERLRIQRLALSIDRVAADELRLNVTDRLASGVAVSDDLRIALPRDRPARSRITLLKQGSAWLVSKVEPVS